MLCVHACSEVKALRMRTLNSFIYNKQISRRLASTAVKMLFFSIGCLCVGSGAGEDGAAGITGSSFRWETQRTDFKMVHRDSSAAHRSKWLLPHLVPGLHLQKVSVHPGNKWECLKNLFIKTKIRYYWQSPNIITIVMLHLILFIKDLFYSSPYKQIHILLVKQTLHLC